MPKRPKISEVELAKKIIEWLELNGWEVFQEVRKEWGQPIADIVARKDGVIWVIETKTSFTLDVMEQADYWKGRANMVSIGIPSGTTRGHKDHAFRTKVCELLGIGILTLDHEYDTRYSYHPSGIREKLQPFKVISAYNWDKILKPEHKDYCEAGATSAQHRFTPFRSTVDQLIVVVRDNPGITLKDAIVLIKHHYQKNATAVACLTKFICNGVIKEIEVRFEDRKSKLYLKEVPK
jgi:hypothetical protein